MSLDTTAADCKGLEASLFAIHHEGFFASPRKSRPLLLQQRKFYNTEGFAGIAERRGPLIKTKPLFAAAHSLRMHWEGCRKPPTKMSVPRE